MAEDNQEKDRKAIEEKALLSFKEYIVDSKVISQYIPENDKEPFWDGHLYLFSNPHKSKEFFIGRVPTQVKGTEVKRFVTKKYKFQIDMVDLKAYLHEPTIYIVCQEKENSKERMLFYRCLLPETVKKIVNGHSKQDSVKVLMHAVPDNLNEFEKLVLVFYGDGKKQISFADKKAFTMDDAKKRGVNSFSFIAPVQNMNRVQLLKYLSTHESYLYAKLNKELDIEIPVSDGPMTFTFQQIVNSNVSVGGKIFYDNYKNEIKDGRTIISIGDTLTINLPMDEEDTRRIEMKMELTPTLLDKAIKEAQFALAMYETGRLSIGNVYIEVRINEKDVIAGLKNQLANWMELQSLLNKLHVTKPFDLSKVTDEQDKFIRILITTIIHGKPIKLEGQKNTIITAEIGNVNLLLWCSVDKDNMCMFGDYFDHTISLYNETERGTKVEVCSYSYLRNDKLWEKSDNIPFNEIIPSYIAIAGKNSYVYEMANHDVLAMISASDSIESIDNAKSCVLLKVAMSLNDWLYDNDTTNNVKPIHIINKMQIIKRQRYLTDEENNLLYSLATDDDIAPFVKAGCWLLLNNKEDFDSLFKTLKPEEQNKIKEFPIWRFVN